jgi:ElaB/YqjD/DUF883 family membrane-anchored ribosome-binding protein
MNESRTSSACDSGGRASKTHNDRRSEAEYLADQSRAASQAIAALASNIKADLAGAADVRAWARQYPRSTIGTAAAVGFAGGFLGARQLCAQSENGCAEAAASAAPEQTKKKTPSLLFSALRGLTPVVAQLLLGTASSGDRAAGDGAAASPPGEG